MFIQKNVLPLYQLKLLIMSQNNEVRYTVVYEGGGKTNLATTIQGNNLTSQQAEQAIRNTNNLTSNVREVIVTEINKR